MPYDNSPAEDAAFSFAAQCPEPVPERAVQHLKDAPPVIKAWLQSTALRFGCSVEKLFSRMCERAQRRVRREREIDDSIAQDLALKKRKGSALERLLGRDCPRRQIDLLRQTGLNVAFIADVGKQWYGGRAFEWGPLLVTVCGGGNPTEIAHLPNDLSKNVHTLVRAINERFLKRKIPLVLRLNAKALFSAELELVHEAKKRSGQPLQEAISWLRQVFEATPEPTSEDLNALAREKNCTPKTLRNALKRIGAKAGRKGFGPGSYQFWHIPHA
jgi:hypothetical protein